MHKLRTLRLEALETRRLLALTGLEQELLQLTNRFRSDPQGEYARLISQASPIQARDASVQASLDAFKVDAAVLRAELGQLTPAPPLSWNEAASNFTKSHNTAMLSTKPPSQFHSDTATRRNALLAAGVDLRFANGEKINSENVFAYGLSPNSIHSAYVIDWGTGPSGMQAGRGHRTALNNPDFDQIGLAITPYSGSATFGPLVSTEVLLNIEKPPAMVVGAVFEDANASRWYEAGEGISAIQIAFDGAAGQFTTTSQPAGGFQLALPAGTYRAIASGGRLKSPIVLPQITIGEENVWQNFIYDPSAPVAIPPTATNDEGQANNAQRTANLKLIANDLDPDGDPTKLIAKLAGNAPAAFKIVNNQLQYTAPAGFAGVHRTQYSATDSTGLESSPATISIFVVDFSAAFPWHNRQTPTDTNQDGILSPLDALLVINDLNVQQSRQLPTAPGQPKNAKALVDTNGDGFISPIDALLIIDLLNKRSEGEGAGEALAEMPASSTPQATDLALQQMAASSLSLTSWIDELRRTTPLNTPLNHAHAAQHSRHAK